MTGRLGRPIAALAVAGGFAALAAPPPAAAFDPVRPICSMAGLISTLAGKVCSAAGHASTILKAGKKLLSGHLGGAPGVFSGGGGGAARAVGTGATLAAVGAWVFAGARFALHETASIISATTRPELQSSWFSGFYWRMSGISALLTLPFLCAAAIQAIMRSDLPMLLGAAFGYLPLGLLAVSIAAPVTMLLLSASDELARVISAAAGHADTGFLAKAGAVSAGLSLGSRSPFVAFFVGLLAVAATLVLWVELLIRSAAVYVIVLMLPLFFAALVWPARRVWAVRVVELLIALILSKFAIVAVLALGGAAMGHTVFPGVTATLAGATLILLAAFSPWVLLRLLPLHELAASAAGGLRAHPQGQLAAGRAEGATEISQEVARELRARLLPQPETASAAAAEAAVRQLAAASDGATEPGVDDGVTNEPGDSEPTPAAGSFSAAAGSPAASSGAPDPSAAARAASTAGPVPRQGAADADPPTGVGRAGDERPPMPAPLSAKDYSWQRTFDLRLGHGWNAQPLADPEGEAAGAREAEARPGARAEDHRPLPPAQEPEGGHL